ncbi:MAG: biotin/lipoate protein ligase [Firmicutes bacterium]|nr:biotin/lipoate protein ligase [Bacillota bacterium]
MEWRILETPPLGGAVNMAIDEAIMLSHSRGEVPPTIRFYRWSPPAVSLGYFQKAEVEIDFDECRRRGIDVIRRLTGGRAVLHDTEITYSLVISENYPGIPSTITGSYRYFSAGLVTGLEKLGIKAQMSLPRSAYSRIDQRKKLASAACFDSPSSYEITYAGRKFVGSAQVRKQAVILQHGSVLLSFSPEKLAAVLKLPTRDRRELMVSTLNDSVTSVEKILGGKINWEEVRTALLMGVCETLEVTASNGCLTSEEQIVSQQLANDKYRNPAWTCKH